MNIEGTSIVGTAEAYLFYTSRSGGVLFRYSHGLNTNTVVVKILWAYIYGCHIEHKTKLTNTHKNYIYDMFTAINIGALNFDLAVE